jgi:hypothetical protein
VVDVRNHHKTVDNVDNFVINSVFHGFVDNFSVDKPYAYNFNVNFSALKSRAEIRQPFFFSASGQVLRIQKMHRVLT